MAVATMKYLNIYGPEVRLLDTLSTVARSELFMPEADEAIHSPVAEANPYGPLLTKAKGLLTDLDENSLVADYIGPEDAYRVDQVDAYLETFAGEVAERNKRKTDLENRLALLDKTRDLLGHMTDLDIQVEELFTTQYLHVRVGRLPKGSYQRLQYYAEKGFNFTDYFNFIVYDFDGEYYWGLYYAPRDGIKDIDDIFASLYFERLWVPEFVHGTPEQAVAEMNAEYGQLRQELDTLLTPTGIAGEKELETIENMAAWLAHMEQLRGMKKYALVYNHTFYISGFVQKDKLDAFVALIDKLDAVHIKEATKTDLVPNQPPTVLKSKWFAKPFEMFTEMYGLPGYHSIDPTFMVAVVYSIAYGLMFADLGQGLVLGLFGYFYMYKRRKMAIGAILARAAAFCCLFGLLFSSVFGYENLLDPMWHALGFHEKPFEVMHADNITTILMVSLGMGVVVVLMSIITNIVQCVKEGKRGSALIGPNGVTGLVFYLGVIILALDILVIDHGVTGHILFILPFILIPLILMYFSEPLAARINGHPEKEKPSEMLLNGFFELFVSILEYLSNTVSFLRVGGFILAHAGMMSVVMTLANMSGGIGRVAIVIFGNVFVICLEGLIVGIQALRLNYYEVFSRFYQPDGIPFAPLHFVSDTEEL